MAGSGNPTDGGGSLLLVVTDGPALADPLGAALSDQLQRGMVERITGFYAAVAALGRGVPILVMDVDGTDETELWRLGSIRAHTGDATVVVVAKDPVRVELAGAVRADLAVAGTSDLPPLREMLTRTTLAAPTVTPRPGGARPSSAAQPATEAPSESRRPGGSSRR